MLSTFRFFKLQEFENFVCSEEYSGYRLCYATFFVIPAAEIFGIPE